MTKARMLYLVSQTWLPWRRERLGSCCHSDADWRSLVHVDVIGRSGICVILVHLHYRTCYCVVFWGERQRGRGKRNTHREKEVLYVWETRKGEERKYDMNRVRIRMITELVGITMKKERKKTVEEWLGSRKWKTFTTIKNNSERKSWNNG